MNGQFVIAKVKRITTKLGIMTSSYYVVGHSNQSTHLSSSIAQALIFNGFGDAMTYIAKNEMLGYEILPFNAT